MVEEPPPDERHLPSGHRGGSHGRVARLKAGTVNESYPYDASLHPEGSAAAEGHCEYHASEGVDSEACAGEPAVSFKNGDGHWQSGCVLALEELVERGEIAPLGQGA